MQVTSAHSAKTPAQPPDWLSVDDVYKLAERTRMRTSLEARHLVLAQAQKMVCSDSGMSRPETGWSRSMTQGQWSPDRAGSVRKQSRGGMGDDFPAEVDEDIGAKDSGLGPGFVSNVEISLKPHNPSAGNISVRGNSHNINNRLGSAMTTVSSYVGSEIPCMSPRPEELEARTMSVARQCCEVMGPGVCRDCQRLRVRMKDREKLEADFPRLRISEKNVTTSAIIKRVLPDMTQAEIQDKIARGEIARSGLLFPRRQCHNSSDNSDDSDNSDKENGIDGLHLNGLHAPLEVSDNDCEASSEDNHGRDTFLTQLYNAASKGDDEGWKRKSKHKTLSAPPGANSKPSSAKSMNSIVVLAKMKLRLCGEASTPLFFMDLKHQNSKIFHGRVGKYVREPTKEDHLDGGERGDREQALSAVPNHLVHPASFVSPRKMKPMQEPAYKVYFDPPLLAKKQQVSNPSFFAGSDDPYSLPERLPDVLEFADGKMSIMDPSTAMRPESSMSVVSEESGETLTHRGEAVKASKGPSEETVHE